ncbi:hypothetical protein OGAPHI_007368 [Ogataea philodendri]|uniref:Uncharacterized protein n=1 Tax=Ogataea philodendri TaxID=1378263 RepID=A0A9P8NUL5_9ASCO|nr:uncharacterized protein OGAPHI_007368 [Ogataea philodendri]KAH3660163.1 hypothetical protein OGAPHI_007368 [Ogataea philodendri]
MLSIQSTTYVGLSFSSSDSAFSRLKSVLIASISHQGAIWSKCLRKQSTLDVPTSLPIATECLLRDERVTWSKSIILTLETPDRTRAVTQLDPTPPAPTTTTNWSRTFFIPSSPRKT